MNFNGFNSNDLYDFIFVNNAEEDTETERKGFQINTDFNINSSLNIVDINDYNYNQFIFNNSTSSPIILNENSYELTNVFSQDLIDAVSELKKLEATQTLLTQETSKSKLLSDNLSNSLNNSLNNNLNNNLTDGVDGILHNKQDEYDRKEFDLIMKKLELHNPTVKYPVKSNGKSNCLVKFSCGCIESYNNNNSICNTHYTKNNYNGDGLIMDYNDNLQQINRIVAHYDNNGLYAVHRVIYETSNGIESGFIKSISKYPISEFFEKSDFEEIKKTFKIQDSTLINYNFFRNRNMLS